MGKVLSIHLMTPTMQLHTRFPRFAASPLLKLRSIIGCNWPTGCFCFIVGILSLTWYPLHVRRNGREKKGAHILDMRTNNEVTL
ncbi:hypothetical protein RSAG8_09314, partial [Rhizoctonia solani AG-8 WAC10335]